MSTYSAYPANVPASPVPGAHFVGTTTDPNTGAVVDQYAIRKQYSQPVQHVQHVTQEQISYVQQMVPEVQTIQVPVTKHVPQQVYHTVQEPHQVTNTVHETRHVTHTVQEPRQITETIMVPQQVTKTIMEPRQVTQAVVEPRQVTSTVMRPRQVAQTVMQAVQEMTTQSITVQKPVQQAVRTQIQVPHVVQSHQVHEHEEIVHHERPRVVQQVVQQVVGGGVIHQGQRFVGAHSIAAPTAAVSYAAAPQYSYAAQPQIAFAGTSSLYQTQGVFNQSMYSAPMYSPTSYISKP